MKSDDITGCEVLAGMATGCFIIAVWVRRRERRAAYWPQAAGKIIISGTKRIPTERGGEEVVPVIEYEFDYEGQKIVTSHWRFANFTNGGADEAASISGRYSEGSSVVVLVNKKDPSKSVLESSISSLSWVLIGLGIFFSALLALALLAAK